ncbi:MAG TPA: pitrilysin family protein [Edaphocola sp.]|nr:pitrilysin family protein [Edaphocola sp.]
MKQLLILTTALAMSMPSHYLSAQTKLVERVEQKGDRPIIPYSKYVLPNGLTVIVHEDHSDPIVHVDVTYHVGSAREEISKSGFAHFFEHMMFQGSDNVADEEHFRIITEAGGTLNGTTNRDRTNYFETVPKNQLEKMLWLESDRMGFFMDAVTQQKFEIQRATVKNERGQNYDNRPYGLVSETSSKALYPYGHTYSWLTIGYVEDLDRVNVQDLKNFFLRWYGPNNATLTVGGDVNTAEVLKLAEKYFGSIPKGPEVKNMKPSYPSLNEDRYITMVDQFAKLPMFRVVYPTPQFYTKEEAALDVLANIIGAGQTSIMYQKLVKPQIALQASAYNSASELAGEFTISLIPFGKHTLKEMDEALKDIFNEFEKRGVTQEDIDKYVAQTEARTIFGLESVSGKVSTLAAYETYLGNPNFLESQLNLYKNLKPQDVMNAYNKFIKGKGSVRLSVATKDNPTNIADDSKFKVDESNYKAPDYGYAGLKYNKAKDNFDRTKMPAAIGELSVVSPNFWTENKKGVSFIGTEIDEIPVVNLSITIPGGRLTETDEKSGLTSLFASMMSEDTKTKSAEAIAKELEQMGSSIRFGSSLEGIDISVRTLTKNLDKTLKILEDRLLNPKFEQNDFDRNKAQSIEGYKNSLSRPASIASMVLPKIMYPDNGLFSRNPGGTDKTLENINLEDIEAYFAKHFNYKDAKVVVVGNLSKKEIMPKLDFIYKMKAGNGLPQEILKFVTTKDKKERQNLYIVDIPGAAQTEFRIAYRTDLKYDANGLYFKSNLMNYPLGGVFNSRLNLYLREDKGWTYGARSGFSGNKYIGYYAFSSGIRADATDSALHDVLRIFKEFKAGGVDQVELDFTKSAKLQSEARMYETGSQKAGYLYNILNYNLPKDIAKQQTQIIKNISKSEIDKLAKTKLPNTDEFIILLVGDKKHLNEATLNQFNVVMLDKEGNPIK